MESPGPRSGSDCVFIKNQSEPDFGPLLPVRPTKRESVRERPERGPSSDMDFQRFLKNTVVGGPGERPERPEESPEVHRP